MIISHNEVEIYQNDPNGVVATVGFFDGVHQGHRFLIEQVRKYARRQSLASAVFTFDEHPRSVLQDGYEPALLHSFPEKIAEIAGTGIDYCIVLNFTKELAAMTAEEFIREVLHKQYRVRTLLVGYDHRFGHNRAEGFEDYVAYGKACGMEVVRVLPYDAGEVRVSSSAIRRMLAEGMVERANELLVHPYQLQGNVVHGDGIGEQLGFPTANLDLFDKHKVVPKPGVYAVWVDTDEMRYKGMLYIGDRPTIDAGHEPRIEVNLLHFSGNLYGEFVRVTFVHYMRDNIKFETLEALKKQLERDRDEADILLVRQRGR